jgi:GNAT superfamily N-acetyltransferase
MEAMGTIRLVEPRTDHAWQRARQLIEAYAESLGLDLSFQNFEHELEHLRGEYSAPEGAFLLAQDDNGYLGCVGVRRFDADAGEVKRLYVLPAARGRGVGRLLAEGIVKAARELGYRRLLLDTLPSMQAARALYRTMGFTPTEAYRFNPVAGTTFLELDLG